MTKAVGFKRYWRMTDSGIERITAYGEVDASWNRGIGPIDRIKQERWLIALSAVHRGKPKPQSQRDRMRDSATGVPKSEAHKKSMKTAHLERSRQIKLVQHELNCTWSEACAEFKKRKAND